MTSDSGPARSKNAILVQYLGHLGTLDKGGEGGASHPHQVHPKTGSPWDTIRDILYFSILISTFPNGTCPPPVYEPMGLGDQNRDDGLITTLGRLPAMGLFHTVLGEPMTQ